MQDKLKKLQNAGEKGNIVKNKNKNTSLCRAGSENTTEENDSETQIEIHN